MADMLVYEINGLSMPEYLSRQVVNLQERIYHGSRKKRGTTSKQAVTNSVEFGTFMECFLFVGGFQNCCEGSEKD
jgi:hypothetical protein